jgi:hypothetical protein
VHDFGPRPEPLPVRATPSLVKNPRASRPDPWAADLKPWKPYVYRGLGFDIFNPYEDEEGDGAQD